MFNNLPKLPIQDVLPMVQETLSSQKSVVLAAEPGSGKTTIVPLALINQPWLAGKKVIMLEPRRLAARMAARRMSELAGDKVGGLVGYRIRFDNKTSPKTRIEVVTEGILTRMILQDPDLTDVGLVVFDEYHERSIHADLALALCLEVQFLRDDLKLMVMSATMDTPRVSQLLSGATIVTGRGRGFPISVNYLPPLCTASLIQTTIKTIYRALEEHDGDILVFLPGAGEIKAIQHQIHGDFICLPLYGDLPQNKQDLVFARTEKRRVILATPIAETSLTIEGVSVVVDSGLMKIPKFSPATGLTSLQTVSISKASAEQRAGRSGRLGPGYCYRLWTSNDHYSKADFLRPEIVDADIAPLLLNVLQWGVKDPGKLAWLDPPSTGQVNQARELLSQLGAIDSKGNLSEIGRLISNLPLHPRLALMLLKGRDQGNGILACWIASLLQNRDPYRGSNSERSVDIEDRLAIQRLYLEEGPTIVQARGADPTLCKRILQEAKQYEQMLRIKGKLENFHKAGNLLALAYPDRIAALREGSRHRYLLASGRGAVLPETDPLSSSPMLVAASLDAGKVEGRIYLAASLEKGFLEKNLPQLLVREEKAYWDKQLEAPNVVEEIRLGALILDRKKVAKPDRQLLLRVIIDAVRDSNLALLPWTEEARRFQARLCGLRDWLPEENWPDLRDAALVQRLEEWLLPYLEEVCGKKELRRLDLEKILRAMLDWRHQQMAEELAPEKIGVPSGLKKKVLYEFGKDPILAVRLQEMFGLADTPRICRGQVPLTLHLLSPSQRPIQITRDLKGFWNCTYAEVKKELKGRYPKHCWPDDPWEAKATCRAKPKPPKKA